jgi:GTP-binding protein Era
VPKPDLRNSRKKAPPAPVAAAAAPVAPRPAPRRKPAAPVRVPAGPHRAGFALLLGKPNVGKSTLLNRLTGEHLAIVSPRPQTTRHRILGVVNRPNTQLALVDAPGVHKAKGLLNKTMVEASMSAISEVDVILYLAEAGWPGSDRPGEEVDVVGPFHREILTQVERAGKPTVLVLTKIDQLDKPKLLPVMQAWSKAFAFLDIYPLSGMTGENVEGLVEVVRRHLPEGPALYAPDHLTDQHERTLVAEYIREQLFLQTRQEIPYGTAVSVDLFDETDRPADEELPTPSLGAEPEAIDEVFAEEPAPSTEMLLEPDEAAAFDAWEADEDDLVEDEDSEDDALGEDAPPAAPALRRKGLVRIEATIVVDRESHKGIVIGKRGQMLRDIGAAARARIERLVGCRVWLGLHVRVIPGWTERRALLGEYGVTGR